MLRHVVIPTFLVPIMPYYGRCDSIPDSGWHSLVAFKTERRRNGTAKDIHASLAEFKRHDDTEVHFFFHFPILVTKRCV